MVEPPETDVVIVGMGWAGGILAAELATAGLSVVGLERGGEHTPADVSERNGYHDELRFRVRQEWAQDAATETWTAAIPDGASIQDWGISYDELEPYYDRFERMAGVSGKAGNLGGRIVPGGNVFKGPRAREFPTGPLKAGAAPERFRRAALELGLHPYPKPGATLSSDYRNPDGIERVATRYCGFCASHPCEIGAKADATVTVLPVARATGNFELRTHANVFRVEHDGRRATGVVYHDADGREVRQRAGIVALAAYTLNNVRLLLLSGLGEPYDPRTGAGTVGRNYAYQLRIDAVCFFRERTFRRYMGMTTAGHSADDFNGDNFDHAGLGFIGGADIGVTSSYGCRRDRARDA